MGSKLLVQKRGKGSPAYTTPSHRFVSGAHYPQLTLGKARGQVMDFIHDPSKDVLLSEVEMEDKTRAYFLAPEGLRINDNIEIGPEASLSIGNITTLEKVPDSVAVFNIELRPRDGGKLARTSGSFATVVGHDEETGAVKVRLPSKRVIELSKECRATIGIACGGGRTEKPFKKAGKMHYDAKARNKRFPVVRGTKMFAGDHPHGGKSFGKSSTVSRHAPPGQKVGHIAASRTGRRRGKEDDTRSQ